MYRLCQEHVYKLQASCRRQFLRRRFLNVFRNFTLNVAPATNQNKGLGKKSHKT